MDDREKLIADIKAVPLDGAADEHWTAGGLVSVDYVKGLVPGATRPLIEEALPGATRESWAASSPSTTPLPTAEQIEAEPFEADEGFDPVKLAGKYSPVELLEALVVHANSDRYRRNGSLYAIAQHYMVEQKAIAAWQERLDAKAIRLDAAAAETAKA